MFSSWTESRCGEDARLIGLVITSRRAGSLRLAAGELDMSFLHRVSNPKTCLLLCFGSWKVALLELASSHLLTSYNIFTIDSGKEYMILSNSNQLKSKIKKGQCPPPLKSQFFSWRSKFLLNNFLRWVTPPPPPP